MSGRHQGTHRNREATRSRRLLMLGGALAAGCLVLVVGLVWLGHDDGTATAQTPRHRGSPSGSAESDASGSPTSSPAPTCTDTQHWGCAQQGRFAAAKKYMDEQAKTNGYLSIVFTDRTTGKVWRYGPTDHPGWTASTIKLAIATDILRRVRAGEVTLSDADRNDLRTMLNWSDNKAADRLWDRYGGDDQLARFRDVFGMSNLNFVPGFTNDTYWGYVKCTSEDLSHLMHYVLTGTNATDRAYLVSAMRGVAPIQQWGVWAAGSDAQPGNKNGWSFETDSYGKHWVLNSVGFAGPDERYTIGIMFQVAPNSNIAYGSHTVSDVVALLFGRSVPAKITVPTPDG